MEIVDSSPECTAQTKPSRWFERFGLSKFAEARDIDGIIVSPDDPAAANLSLSGAIKRSYPGDIARWLEISHKLDALLADLHGDVELRMTHGWLPDSRFNRIRRANDHCDFSRDDAIWLLTMIGE